MIGIDTYSWKKIINLLESDWRYSIIELIDKINIFTTTEGKNEFQHRFPDRIDLLDNIAILPLLKSSNYNNLLIRYDPTDASLLEYNDMKGYRLITEDSPLLDEGITSKRNIIQLIDFLFENYKKHEFFSKKEMYHLITLFRSWKNISKKKANFYLNHL